MGSLSHNVFIRKWLFIATKYITYGVLIWNGYQFYIDETAAAETTFANGLYLIDIIEVYSATIDTTFWILLVVLLELETYVIDDDILRKPAVKWTMLSLRGLCYIVIIYALYGYIVKTVFQADIEMFSIGNVCSLVGQNYFILLEFETYTSLTSENCQRLNGLDLGQLSGHKIIAPMDDLIYARNVAVIDVFNASAWLGVVAVLEVDTWQQLKGNYKGALYRISYILKAILYTTLFACAIAWGYTGVWLDITDAALWLFAFFFIEMNLFQWQQETEAESSASLPEGASQQTGIGNGYQIQS